MIIKRCFYCNPKHLMDEDGNPIQGDIVKGHPYSDGICKIAFPIAEKENQRVIEKMRLDNLVRKLMGGEI